MIDTSCGVCAASTPAVNTSANGANVVIENPIGFGYHSCMTEVTRILSAIEAGNPQAAAQLLPLVYDELRGLAAGHMANESPGHTLTATALVHEAYVRLVGPAGDRAFANRGHFFAAAAEAMRRILVDSARRKQSRKRGGGLGPSQIEADRLAASIVDADSWLDLDEALTAFQRIDSSAAELAKIRIFGGLSVEEAGDALNMSRATAFRTWTYARAYLTAALADRSEKNSETLWAPLTLCRYKTQEQFAMPVDPNVVRDVFLTAAELPPADRQRYLTEHCGSDDELRAAVERLLAAHEAPASILERSLAGDSEHPFAATDPAVTVTVGETDEHDNEQQTESTAGATLATLPTEHPSGLVAGQVIAGRYTLRQILGEGGMGTVYRADQTEPVKRQVALKVIKIGMDSRTVLARFNARAPGPGADGPPLHRASLRWRHDRRRPTVLRDGTGARRPDHTLLRR